MPIQVDNGNWSMYFQWFGDEEQFPVMIFVDETYAEQIPDDYNQGVRITILLPNEIRYITENAMIQPEVNLALQQKEADLIQRIEEAGVHAKLVSRSVGAARKVFRFQTRDVKLLTPVLQVWASEIDFVKDVDIQTGKKWKLYEEVSPKVVERMQMSDRELIETLLENGAEEDKLYDLEFTFLGPSDKLDIIQKDLEEEEFVTATRESDRLVLVRPLPLDLKTIFGFTSYMMLSSIAHECQYDGWGCRLN